MSIAFLRSFRKRQTKPKVGDWRIVQIERADGSLTYHIERFVNRWETPSIWAIPSDHWYRGCCQHDSLASAQALLDKWIAYWRDAAVVSTKVVAEQSA